MTDKLRLSQHFLMLQEQSRSKFRMEGDVWFPIFQMKYVSGFKTEVKGEEVRL